MNTIAPGTRTVDSATLPLLENGDRMTQAEFHRRYEAYPDHVKYELIGGIVFMASPLRRTHGRYHVDLGTVFNLYQIGTPGVDVADNATAILGEESEPQPDLAIRILTEFGGQSQINADKYLEGAPELVAEIALSTRAIDLHLKKLDYQRAGVIEYVVLCVEEQKLYWFHFPSGESLTPNREGIYRSRVFPGLWIDGPALMAQEGSRLVQVVQQGLASRAHAAFVKRLHAARRRHS
jgi:Uma2 family endonuclease